MAALACHDMSQLHCNTCPYLTLSLRAALSYMVFELQELELQMATIYDNFAADIAATISNSSSSTASQLSTASADTSFSVASGCARDSDGDLRVHFYVSAANITREIDGLLASRRRLQSTPCSSSDGTSVGPSCAKYPLPVLYLFTCAVHALCLLCCAMLCYAC